MLGFHGWMYACAHRALTLELITKYVNSKWNLTGFWKSLSRNPNVTWKYVQANIDWPWQWEELSENPNITWDIIQRHSECSWVPAGVTRNPNITETILRANLEYPWDWQHIFEIGTGPQMYRPLSIEFIHATRDKHNYLFANSRIQGREDHYMINDTVRDEFIRKRLREQFRNSALRCELLQTVLRKVADGSPKERLNILEHPHTHK